jgi:acetylornithine deacetylase/succinyl-diaminopimelate desuccinylase-like protein
VLSKKLLQLFEHYVNLDTSRKDGKFYEAAIDLLSPFLSELGFENQKMSVPSDVAGGENRVNLISKLMIDPSLPDLLIYNHIDVVPAAYKNAFCFELKNDRAYGRGTGDHKGSTIAVLDAQSKVKKDSLRFNIIFILTTDEETSQLPQLQYLEKHLKLNLSKTYCFNPDTFAGGITSSHLGIFQFIIKAQGKSVHSGMSHLGVNAVTELMSLYPILSLIKQKYDGFVSTIQSFPYGGQATQVRSSFNLNVIRGGLANNIVPDLAELIIDVRLTPEFNVGEEKKWIKKQLQTAFAEKTASFEIIEGETYEGYACESPEIDRLEELLKARSGEAGQYCVMGSTPVADWTKKLGIPHFGLGVARYDSHIHGVDENCSLEDIYILSDVFLKYVQK